jgi:acyl-CoA thioesterase FadM
VGVSEPANAGAAALVADGYRFVIPVEAEPLDFDAQGHLNNASTVRLFNDLRVAYVRGEVGDAWVEMIRRDRLVVAAREVHVLYESEGFPGEAFVGGLRYVRREGKAAVLEQRLVEAATGRGVARAWVVQLLVQDGKVVDWPDEYFSRVTEIEGREIPTAPRRPAETWGPPPL